MGLWPTHPYSSAVPALTVEIYCVVWFQKISIPPMEGYWKFQGGGGLEVKVSKECGG